MSPQDPLDEDEIAQINDREEILLRIRKLAQEIDEKVRRLLHATDGRTAQNRGPPPPSRDASIRQPSVLLPLE